MSAIHDHEGLSLGVAVTLVIVYGIERAVDRQFGEIRSNAAKLSVDVREQAPLQQRVIGKIDARYHMAGVERDSLGLGEIFVGVTVERHGMSRHDG